MTDEITLDAPETRLERFLAAAAGMDGITLDEPETRIERYLYKIAQGSGGVPTVEDADKGKYLHANESTGDLEWAVAGGGGGASTLVVNVTETEEDGVYIYTCDKTAGEILSALEEGSVVFKYVDNGFIEVCVCGGPRLDSYTFFRGGTDVSDVQFVAFELPDYPYYEEH